MEQRTLLIAGGAVVVIIAAGLYFRARGGDEAESEPLSGSTLLFTPPAPLSAPGAGNWESGTAPALTAGSSSFSDASALADAIAAQDTNAARVAIAQSMDTRELGQASLLSSYAAQIISHLPSGPLLPGSFTLNAALNPTAEGGLSFTSDFWAAPILNFPVEQWVNTFSGVQVWQSTGGAYATRNPGAGIEGQMITGLSGGTFSVPQAVRYVQTHSAEAVNAWATEQGISSHSLGFLQALAATSPAATISGTAPGASRPIGSDVTQDMPGGVFWIPPSPIVGPGGITSYGTSGPWTPP